MSLCLYLWALANKRGYIIFLKQRIMYCKDKLSRVTSFVGFLSCYWDIVHLIPSVPDVWIFSLFFILFDLAGNYHTAFFSAWRDVVMVCRHVFLFLKCGLSITMHFVRYCITSLIPISRMKKEQPWWLLITSPRGYMWELPLGQDIASGDLCSSDSPSYTCFTSLNAKV